MVADVLIDRIHPALIEVERGQSPGVHRGFTLSHQSELVHDRPAGPTLERCIHRSHAGHCGDRTFPGLKPIVQLLEHRVIEGVQGVVEQVFPSVGRMAYPVCTYAGHLLPLTGQGIIQHPGLGIAPHRPERRDVRERCLETELGNRVHGLR